VLSLLALGMATQERSLSKEPLVIGYANWGQCDESIIQHVKDGVNVVIWFSINLIKSPKGKPIIQGGPDYDKVAHVISKIQKERLMATHLIAIGGWNSPHIDTTFSAQEWWDTWNNWNQNIAQPSLGFSGFDGFDWDLEGNDDLTNSINHFTISELKLMGELSQIAKKNSYIVSMAPSQSYLDYETREFSMSLLHDPTWKKGFRYHGRNVYAFIVAKYGETEVGHIEGERKMVRTFDFISIQLYEGWSRANQRIYGEGKDVTEYLNDLIVSMEKGWEVEFSREKEAEMEDGVLKVPGDQLVIGLANGWAGPNDGGKFMLVWPESQIVYERLKVKPRGWMFWNLLDEGKVVEGKEFRMVKEIYGMMKGKQKDEF